MEKAKLHTFSPEISEKAKRIQGRGVGYLVEQDVPRWHQKKLEAYNAGYQNAPKYHISSTSDKLVHDRFETDFEDACLSLEVIRQPAEAEGFRPEIEIGCASMSQLMLRLGFVHRQLHQDEQLALADIWRKAGGDTEGQRTVPLSNVKNLLRAIQNFHHQEILDLDREED